METKVTRKCRKCQEMKDIHTDFYPSRVKRYDWICKPCIRKLRNLYGSRQMTAQPKPEEQS